MVVGKVARENGRVGEHVGAPARSSRREPLGSARGATPVEQREVQRWRRQVLERVTFGSFLVAALNLAVDLREAAATGDYRFIVPATVAAVGLGALTFLHRLPWQLRAGGFVVLVLTACTQTLAHSGFLAPNVFVIGSGVTVLIAVSVGTRAAYATLFAFLTCLAYAANLHVRGDAVIPGEIFNVSSPQAWLRVAIIFTACTGIAIFGVSLLTRRLEEALSHGGELLETLRGAGRRQRAAMEQQQELQERLRRSQRLEALGRLSGGVAHDFNNLLSVVMNHCAAAQRHTSGSSAEHLQAIEEASKKAAALTRQMLSFGRQHSRDLTTTDLAEAVEHALDLVRRLLPSNIQLRFRRSSARTPIAGGPADVDQLVLNLCLNARDAMPKGGALSVEVDEIEYPVDGSNRKAPHGRLRITDQGVGMSEHERARIFEPFYTTKSKLEGTGLGLSVVQDVVRQHEGHIDVTSQAGRGSTFSVLLPAQYESLPESGLQLKREQTGHRVLLVDDESEVREALTQLARDAGYRVTACGSGEEALECLKRPENDFDVVVTDFVMPCMTGKALYRATQEVRPDLPFVFLSAYGDCDLQAIEGRGAVSSLSKPVTQQELSNAIEGAAEHANHSLLMLGASSSQRTAS